MPKLTKKEMAFQIRYANFVKRLYSSENQSIGTCIEQHADTIPNHAALLFEDKSWTWAQFNEESNKIANFFLKLGLSRGDTVGLMLENSPAFLFITTGINKIRGISAFLNFNQKKKALIHSFNVVDSKWIIVDASCLESFNEIQNELTCPKENIFVINNHNTISHEYIELAEKLKSSSITNPTTTFKSILRETALYIFTSGTTGLPKAVNMENLKLFTQAGYLGVSVTQITPQDVLYNPLPLYHNTAFGTAWMSCVFIGATFALRKRFSASEFWKDIQKYKATCLFYVGEIVRYLLNQTPSEFEKNHTLNKLTGLGLRKDVWLKIKERFKIEHVFEYYGLTEGHRTLFNADEVPGMIGRDNMPGIKIAKVHPDSGEFIKNEKELSIKAVSGDTGMILLQINKTDEFRGYKDKNKTQKKVLTNVFKQNDKYFNTGDMVKVHENKYLSFADRTGDTYRWKSENVSTLEVEEILCSFPAIQLSGVYGVDVTKNEGKAGMATIKLDSLKNFNLEDFSKFVIGSFPVYSIPLFVRIKDELEMTGPMKIKKVNLKKEAYNINQIKDPLYFWDSSKKQYVTLDESLHQKILEGKMKI